jgi:hypothetical protein
MGMLDVGIAIGASSRAIGYLAHNAGSETMAVRAEAVVRLVQLGYGLPIQSSVMRLDPDDPDQWGIETLTADPESAPVPAGVRLGSPVRYLGLREPRVRWDVARLAPPLALDPPGMLADLLAPMVETILDTSPEFRVGDVVLTVPLACGGDWNTQVAEACRLAGVRLVEAVAEPVAILTHYAFAVPEPWRPDEQVLIVDWGGDALRLTMTRFLGRDPDADRFDVLGAIVLPGVGGNAIDARVGRALLRPLGGSSGVGRRRGAIFRLLATARSMKVEISNSRAGEPAIRYLDGHEVMLDREGLVRSIEGNADGEVDISALFSNALHDLRNVVGTIDRVLLAGGSARLPVVMPVIRDVLGEDIAIWAHGETARGDLDQVAVRGATVRAAQRSGHPGAGRLVSLRLPPLLPHDIGIRLRGGVVVPLAWAGTAIDRPVSATRTLETDVAGDVVVECVSTAFAVANPATRRLAGINLGPIARGARIACRLDIVDLNEAALTVTWAAGHAGPIPIHLGMR